MSAFASLPDIIKYASNLSPVPGLWLGRRQRGLLWYYLWICLICDLGSLTIRELNRRHLLEEDIHGIFSNAFFILQFGLIAVHLCREIAPGRTLRWCIAAISGMCAFYAIFVIQAPFKISFERVAIQYGILILLCIVAFYKVIRNIEHTKIEQSPLFIFTCGFILYASGSLMLILFKDNLATTSAASMKQLWSIHNTLNILKNLSIAWVFSLRQNKAASVA